MIAPSASMTIVERIPSTKRSTGTRFTAFASNLSSRPRSATTIQKPMHSTSPQATLPRTPATDSGSALPISAPK